MGEIKWRSAAKHYAAEAKMNYRTPTRREAAWQERIASINQKKTADPGAVKP